MLLAQVQYALVATFNIKKGATVKGARLELFAVALKTVSHLARPWQAGLLHVARNFYPQ